MNNNQVYFTIACKKKNLPLPLAIGDGRCLQTAQLRPTGQESRLVLVGGEEPEGKDASEGNNKDFPNLGHHSLERDVPVTSWPIVAHAGMVLPGRGDGSQLPEPTLLARNRSGAGVAGTFVRSRRRTGR